MVWKMLFEEFQDACLVHGHLCSEWDDFSYSESPCCLTHPSSFCVGNKWVGRCLKNIKMSV